MNLGSSNSGLSTFSFGGLANTSAPSTSFNFGAPISSIAQTSTVTPLNFSSQTSAATPFSLTAQPAQTAAFNLSTQTTSAPTGLFGMSGTSSTATLPTLSTGLTMGLGNFGFASSTATTSNAATTNLLTNVATPGKIGLGGVNLSESNLAATTMTTTFNNVAQSIKESPVEPLIGNLVTEFMKYIKEQKTTREDISRWSAGTVSNVSNDVKTMASSLHHLNSMIQSLSSDVQRLKITSKQDVTNVEIAQKTHCMPISHQYENVLPMRYFQQLLISFDERMLAYRHEILVVEEFIQHITDNHTLSPQEFGQIFRKLSLGFVELTAQIQIVYESIKELKSTYFKFRSQMVADNKSIFSPSTNDHRMPLQVVNGNRTPSTIGPSMFSGGSPKAINIASTPRYSSLFSTSVSNQQQQTSAFSNNIGSTNQPTPLFGNTTTATTSASLFSGGSGGIGAGGLFGNAPTGTFGGLFGSNNSTPAGASGGLFGGTNFNTGSPTLATSFGSPAFGASAQKSSGNKRGKNS